ncbi:PIN domain-containing protein [Rhizobium sp. 16-449-1b]|uniref:type II toxin-antitoxin system VapC family toxin n=1 Tax=Rhizobium sp. 16-449-1b TaxID=2819989 RepID=UPI001ADB0D9C|nr:PIN domain-containing protein [Rhizobium sp. 16-449-1b]MBO9198141.1 PIN domain-containing protein [Rhizobium sp. 16-449-1b]
MAAIILDTNIISEAYQDEPPGWLIDWFKSLPPDSVVIPWTLVYETEYGIHQAQRNSPAKSESVREWFEKFLLHRMTFLDMTKEGARLLGRMAACPPLRNMFETPPRINWRGERIKSDKIRLGVDAMVAAMAIAHDTPIASFNTKDFVLINQYFQLPGLYDPRKDEWAIDPPLGWSMDAANDDRPNARHLGDNFEKPPQNPGFSHWRRRPRSAGSEERLASALYVASSLAWPDDMPD